MKSVLQNWVMELPLREQGTLLTVIRGCDLVPKLPLDGNARHFTAWMRYCILNPADVREVGIKGAFMQSKIPNFKWSEFDHLPHHWVMHALHAVEVIGFRHPWEHIRIHASVIYIKGCISMHLRMETKDDMIFRLSEDRIASGEVVS